MRSVSWIPTLIVVCLSTPCFADGPQTRSAVHAAKTLIDVQRAPERVRPQVLGTAGYRPADRERPFLEKTPPEERTNGSILNNKTPYDLSARAGKRVAWFGIVRGIERRPDGRHELLLEHKYFDGLTDLHILALSFNGAGDFKAVVAIDNELPLKPLMLVRVYGVVAKPAKDKPPAPKAGEPKDGGSPALVTVNAEYVRGFPWKTFTFLDTYGKDQSNPRWRELCKVELDRIYDPYPNEEYYQLRLGKEPE
jgi:hypothetical protein